MKTLNNLLLPLLATSALFLTQVASRKDCATNKKTSTSKLICYYSTVDDIDGCYCTHVILPSNADIKSIERAKERAKGVKVYVSVHEFNQGLIDLLKTSKIDGLEINLKKFDSKNDISDFISTVKSKLGADLEIALSVPSKSDLVVKYFDFKALSKYTDFFILQTAFLGASTNVTFHPSRLSGMWDMQNTDSVVDLISGLGAPLSKLVIAAPVQAFQFILQSPEYTAPGSPAVEVKSVTRDELCDTMHGGKNWTLERDEDQAGPYIFRKNEWIAFEDLKSMDIKAKYSRVRGLAGIALKDLTQDGGSKCGSTILEATYNGLSRQTRAPRGAVLHSLEREILESPTRSLDSVHLSPYRISRIIDTEGKIHVTRQDSRTEFQCSRQGYFVHPRSCNRFYRCVKFDQRSEDFNVFEFDCPAGLAFDERVEVCVWPGSLPHGTPCSGSSEIAPVPRKRFECPSEPGYYADPENCRWFFACLDHGKSPLEAYEFRCPFGLGFDGARLVCEWPWLVPKCASGLGVGLDSEYYYGGASGNNGHVGTGTQSSGLLLQNYDGLGALGTIHLGGISGKIEQPIATVYSNVGSGVLGLGYQNNGGYIFGGGGLGYKAAQSLAQAGLLKVNNGAGYQAIEHNHQGTVYTTSDRDSGNANIQYSSGTYEGQGLNSEYAAGSGHSGQPGGAVSTQSFIQYTNQQGPDGGAFLINANGANAYAAGQQEASGNLQYQGATGQDSTLHLVQGGLGGTGYATTGTGISGGSLQNLNQLHEARQEAGVYAFAPVSFGQQQDVSAGYQNAHVQVAGGDQQSGNYAYQSGIGGVSNGHETSKNGVIVTGYTGPVLTNLEQQNRGYVAVSGNGDQGYNGYSGSYVTGKTDFASEHANDYGQHQGYAGGGAVSTQSFTQFNGQDSKASGKYDSGINGNINIIGGGYSAVGTIPGIHVSNNGDANDVKTVSFTSTPSPISVTTYAPISTVASVPTVTAVPVPGIRTAAGFETFKGGVIANIPELQYKVKSHGDAGFLANISSSFANFVVTTPVPAPKQVVQQTYSQDGGYVYENPGKESLLNPIVVSTARPFVTVTTQEPKHYASSTVKPIAVQQEYVYQKPAVAFQENQVFYSTPSPAVSTVTYQKYDSNGGYKYEKPSVVFEEKPQGVVVDTYSTVSTPKPAVYVAQQQGGYHYNKPAVTLEEGPTNPIVVSKFAVRNPTVQQTGHTGGYYYEKPTVTFEERPIVVQQQPAVINEIPSVQLKQKAIVGNYAYQQPAQPAVVSQYYYQQPVVKQQPIVPLYKQPELLGTYTYQPPVQQTIYKQPVSRYTYQTVAQQSVGLTHDKPRLTLVTKPAQTFSYQPSGGTSYQYVKFENNLQGKPVRVQSQGYQYPQPSIAFEERPQLGVVSNYQYSTPQPNVVVKQTKAQEGYVYEKPAVVFGEAPVTYSTPKPTIAVQPAVVTSYFNTGSSQSAQTAVDQQRVDHSYLQPVVNFKESPIVYSTPKPFVAVQPVTPVQSQGYEYPKPSIAFEEIPQIRVYSTPQPNVVIKQTKAQEGYVYEKPGVVFGETYSTPKPTIAVQPAVVTSYFNTGSSKSAQAAVDHSYLQPIVKFKETPVVYSTPKPFVAVQPVTPVQSQGYEYPKPSIAFEERPQIRVYSTPQPNVVIKQTKAQEGYVYEKPAVAFEEAPVIYSTPKPTIAVQPAVVTSYFDTDSSKSAQAAVYQQHVDHSYLQPVVPVVKFKETPVAYSTPRPFVAVQPVTPAVVTSYFNIESSTSKPNVLVQEPIIYSTPKPFVHQPDVVVQQKVGYTYPKPEIRFEETPVQPAVVSSYNYVGSTTPQPNIIVEEQQPQVIVEHKPAVVTSYFHQQPSQPVASKGYVYPKPSVQFVEEPQPVQEVPFVKKTAYLTGQYQQNAQDNYDYEQGTHQHTGKVVVENYLHPNYEKVKQAVFGQQLYQQQPQVLLNYVPSTPKPTFASTIKSLVTKTLHPVTPATVTYYDSRYTPTPETYVSSTVAPQINIVSSTSRPILKYSFSSLDDQYQYNQNLGVSKSTTPESSYSYIGSTTPQPNIIVEEQPIIYTSKPKVVVEQKPAVVTSYFHQQPGQSVGYDYPKPAVQFVEEPVIGQYQQNAQNNYDYQQGTYQHTGKVVVENYVHPNYEKVKQAVFGQQLYQQQPQVLLNYVPSTPKPTFVSIVKSLVTKTLQPVTPATVTYYDSRYIPTPETYVSSTVAPQINIVSSTSRPILKYSFSSLDDQYQYNQNVGVGKSTTPEPSYSYIGSTTPQPNIIVEEQPIIYTKPKVVVEQKPAIVTSYFHQQPSQPVGYDYPKPAVQFAEEPQQVFTNYDNREPVEEVPFVKKTAYVTGNYQQNAQENYNYQQGLQGNYQHTGKVVVENYVNPNYEKVRQELFGQKVYQQQEVQYQQPQVVLNYVHQSTPKPSFVSTVKAIATKNLQPVTPATVTFYDSRYTSTPESYVSSTVAPEVNIVSTSRPISRFSFSSLDDQYQYDQHIDLVKSTTPEPARTYLPVTSRVRVTSALPKITTAKVVDEYVVPEITTLARDYLPVRIRTKAPAREYLPVEITTPSREYLPSRQRVAVATGTAAPEVTTLFREYLPVRSRVRVTTTGAPLDDLSYTSRRPTAVVRPTTVIKQNDAHPLLSAKLGAQCTCVSNNLRLRKKQKIIIVDEDDQNDDDGYIVDDGSQVENYSYEPQRVVDIVPTPQVYVQSTSVAPQTYIRKRVKVRPVLKQSYLPVTQASDIFYKQDTSLEDSAPSDGEIVKAVRTGLKLVKQAAKEGAREGAQEALSSAQFDRYGPGGVRSRSETLQGTIDCQRAGLFRHPTECNKFYACRWDCTKNRFTLHIFNCPVHLTFDNTMGACNWPSQGPACVENTLITSD